MRSIAVLVLVLVLGGCSTIYTSTPLDFNSAEMAPNEGIIFMSTAQERNRFYGASYRFRFRNEADDASGSFGFRDAILATPVADLRTENGLLTRGSVKAYTLPAGRYRFDDFSIVQGHYGGYTTWGPTEEFSIPFTVEPGRVTYLGEIRMIPVGGRNIFGIPMLAGGVFEISSHANRDMALFQQRFPGVNPELIVIRPLQQGDVPPELITFR